MERNKKLIPAQTIIATISAPVKNSKKYTVCNILYGNITFVNGKIFHIKNEFYIDLLTKFLSNNGEGSNYVIPTRSEINRVIAEVQTKEKNGDFKERAKQSLELKEANNVHSNQRQKNDFKHQNKSANANASGQKGQNQSKVEANNIPLPTKNKENDLKHEEKTSAANTKPENKDVLDKELKEKAEKIEHNANAVKRDFSLKANPELNSKNITDQDSKKNTNQAKEKLGTKIQTENSVKVSSNELAKIAKNPVESEKEVEPKTSTTAVNTDKVVKEPKKEILESKKEAKNVLDDLQKNSTKLLNEFAKIDSANDTVELFDTNDEELKQANGTIIKGIEDFDLFKENEEKKNSEVKPEMLNDDKFEEKDRSMQVLVALVTKQNEEIERMKSIVYQKSNNSELNFDLSGLEKEFNKMNEKITKASRNMKLGIIVMMLVTIAFTMLTLYSKQNINLSPGDSIEVYTIVKNKDGVKKDDKLVEVFEIPGNEVTIENSDNVQE